MRRLRRWPEVVRPVEGWLKRAPSPPELEVPGIEADGRSRSPLTLQVCTPGTCSPGLGWPGTVSTGGDSAGTARR
jgi:hypothetical protein